MSKRKAPRSQSSGDVVFEFWQLEFTHAELNSLPPADLAFIVSSCLAANDVAISNRTLALVQTTRAISPVVREINLVNQMRAIRGLAAELIQFLKLISERVPNIVDDELRSRAATETEACRTNPNFAIAHALRNRMTHHYSAHAASEGLAALAPDQTFSIFLHSMNGNTYYPLAENVGNAMIFRPEQIPGLLDWTISTGEALTSLHQQIMVELIRRRFPKKDSVHRLIPVESRFVGDLESKLPILLRNLKHKTEANN